MKKIHNKKGFRSGLLFLFLAITGTILTILRFKNLDKLLLLKDILINILTYLISITLIIRSLSSTYSEEDTRDYDERSKLVKLKAQSSSFMICFSISLILNVLLILGYALTKVDYYLYLYIPMGIFSGIMFITIIVTSLYYDKKY